MNRFAVLVFLALLLAGPASAQVEQKVLVCAACHGQDGIGVAPTFPNLAGQHPEYTLQQLQMIKSGERMIPTMMGLLDNMSDADLAAIADYYAARPAAVGVARPENIDLGQQIYRAGISERDVAACIACHGPAGAGNGPAKFPHLAGQKATYTASSLKAYRDGSRANAIMQGVAERMNDREIDAVANYIQGLR